MDFKKPRVYRNSSVVSTRKFSDGMSKTKSQIELCSEIKNEL